MLLRNITSQSETSSSRPASIARYFEASTEQNGGAVDAGANRGTEISRVQRLQWSSFGSEKQ